MQQPDIPVPPAPPAPNLVYVRNGVPSATATYEAFTAQRQELRDQLESLQDKRRSIAERLREGNVSGADRSGLETRLTSLDDRIAVLDKQLAAADAQVAQAAAVPGAVAGHEALERAQRLSERRSGPPEEMFVVMGIFTVVVFFPISIAVARRIWRRSAAAVTAIPGELMERMHRLEQGVESIAIEVERIGEGQRFMTRIMSDAGARPLGAGPAEPVRQQERDAVPLRVDTSR